MNGNDQIKSDTNLVIPFAVRSFTHDALSGMTVDGLGLGLLSETSGASGQTTSGSEAEMVDEQEGEGRRIPFSGYTTCGLDLSSSSDCFIFS